MIRFFLSGILIGIANIVPGVSGGTVAVILNLYDRLISSIRQVMAHPFTSKSDLFFLLQIGSGAIVGVLLFSHLISVSLSVFPKETMGFFIGLIAASIPIVWKSHSDMKMSLRHSSLFVIVCFGLLGIVFLCEPVDMGVVTLTLTLPKVAFLFFSGFIASSTMIIPGISGSFMLLILGSYYVILNAVSSVAHQLLAGQFFMSMDLLVIIIVGLGAFVGIVSCSRGIFFLLNRFPKDTYYVILGLITASLIQMLMSLVVTLNIEDFLPVMMSILVGVGTPFLLNKSH